MPTLSSYTQGRTAEKIAKAYLCAKGYRIIAERYKTPVGEIDLIAEKDQMLIAIEVKYRPTQASAIEAITGRQRQRITRAMDIFLQQRTSQEPWISVRFDAIVLSPWQRPLHIRNAWILGDW